jgi:hypothetical protein
MPPRDRDALIQQLLQEYATRLHERLPHGPLTLDEIETIVEELGREQDARLEELLIQDQTPPPTNQVACPACAGRARYKRDLPLHVLTIHGTRVLARRYYQCSRCGKGHAPLDLRLRLDGRTATRRVRAWQARLASEAPFASVPALLLELRGLVVSASTVERTTVELGTALQQATHAPAPGAAAAPGATDPGSSRRRRRVGPGVQRLYLGLDGVYCPLRERWRKDGSHGALVCRWGECKVGVIFQTNQREDGLDEGVRWRAYTATLADVEGFTPAFLALARRVGVGRAVELVALGDGAAWIWALYTRHFPQAVQIVDFWHATQHLYTVAHARFGSESPAAAAWVRECQALLCEDLVSCVIGRIEAWEPQTEGGQEVQERELGYFQENRERLRYGTFLKHGYQVGSGVVESACRQLVTQRLKGAGMHWREGTAEAVLALRAALKSSEAPDLRTYA